MPPQNEPRHSATPDRVPHARHHPEETLLYQIVQQHYPAFLSHLESEGRGLPRHVRKEFEAYLKCGRIEHGFLRLQCEGCHDNRLVALSCKCRGFCPSCAARRMVDSAALLVDEILPVQPLRQWVLTLPIPLRYLCANDSRTMGALLGIAYRTISSHLIKQAGRTALKPRCGAVTLIQRFGGALNLNIHFHMLFLDGVYTEQREGGIGFHRLPPPDPRQIQVVLTRISRRIGRWLERRGLLERDMEDSHLTLPDPTLEDSALPDLQAHSLTYRIALGRHRGSKAFTLQNAPPKPPTDATDPVARIASFSLHAGLLIEEHKREKLEHLCRYIARPPLCLERLRQSANGKLTYGLKTPWKNGTTHLVFDDPIDFIGRLAALIPAPRAHLTRFHGVFAPHSALRAYITPAGRGSRPTEPDATPQPKRQFMNWAQRLKRVFNIDVTTCEHCSCAVKIVSYIGSYSIIQRIIEHLSQVISTQDDPQDPAHQPQGPPLPSPT